MSTEEPAQKPPEERRPPLPPDAGDPAGSARPEAASTSDAPEQLSQEIERTREQLGETVEALVAKADIKAATAAKLSGLSSRAAGQVTQAKEQAAGQADRLRAQVTGKAAVAATRVSEAAPEPVKRAAKKTAATARQRRVPLAVMVIVIAAGLAWLVIAVRRRR